MQPLASAEGPDGGTAHTIPVVMIIHVCAEYRSHQQRSIVAEKTLRVRGGGTQQAAGQTTYLTWEYMRIWSGMGHGHSRLPDTERTSIHIIGREQNDYK